jgi:hypothetical protein
MQPRSTDAIAASMIRNLEARTGLCLDEWIEITAAECPALSGTGEDAPDPASASHREVRRWLTSRYRLGPKTAWLIAAVALRHLGGVDPSQDEMVDEQYLGRYAPLRPVYDAIAFAARQLGDDVEIRPALTHVTLARGNTFAIVKPRLRSVRLGLRLPDGPAEPSERLIARPWMKGRVTHTVDLASIAEVDGEVQAWMRQAYQARGENA